MTFLPVDKQQENSLNDLCVIINDWAEKKGWNETPDSVSHKAEQIALMHSELSECLEFVRKKIECECPNCHSTNTFYLGQLGAGVEGFNVCPQSIWKCRDCGQTINTTFWGVPHDDHVPSLTGEAAELADVLIRIFHYCGRRGINLGEAVRLKHEYNIGRPYRHGKNC